MSRIEKNIDEKLDITSYVCTGKLTLQDIFDTLQEFYRQPTKHLIFDVCDADVSATTGDDLKKIVSMSKTFANSRPGGKTAILGSSDLQFGLARMFTTFTEFEHHPIQTSAFRDLDAAKRWIAGTE